MLVQQVINVKVTFEELMIIRQAVMSTCAHEARQAEVIYRLCERLNTLLEDR